MRFVWSSTLKDIKRHLRDPLEILTWLGIPLLIGFMIVMATGGKSGPTPKAHLLVADEDASFISGLLVGALNQDSAGEFIQAENINKQEGIERMDKGSATALLIIPKGFGNALLLEEPSVLRLITNPSQQILPKIVEETLSMLLDGVFYLHRLIGEDLQNFADGPAAGADTFSDLEISTFSVKINRLVGGLSDYLNPPLIEVERKVQEEKEDSGSDVNVGTLFLPGILFMSLLFMALAISADLWQEKEQNTLLRMVMTPQSAMAFMLGKLLAGGLFMFFISVIALIIGYFYFSLASATFPFAVLWATLTGTMFTTLLMLLQLFASSQRGGSILTMALIFPLMMVGGSFFPFEAMPAWMASVGKFTPNGWALEHLKNIILQRTDISSSAAAFLGVSITTLILFSIAVWRLRTKFVIG